MSLKCSQHKDEIIERVCASTRWKMNPALCWQCMIDQAEHVKEHRDQIIKLEDFTVRIAKEFVKVRDARSKDQRYANQDYLKLMDESQYQLELYQYIVDKRKAWVSGLIQSILNEFTQQLDSLQTSIFANFDLKIKNFQDQLTCIKSSIELRYGLVPLPTAEEMNDQLEALANDNKDCNPYIRELKDKLLPPIDLEKNLQFQESLSEYYQLKEISEKLQSEMEAQEKVGQNEDQEPDADGQQGILSTDMLETEILSQAKEQCVIFVDEIRLAISFRDPILAKNRIGQQFRELSNNDSLHSKYSKLNNKLALLSPDGIAQSRQRTTFAQKLLEGSPFKESRLKENQFAPSFNSPFKELKGKIQRQEIQDSSQIVQFDKSIETGQTRGITTIQLLAPNCIATGSRDKTVCITYLDDPQNNIILSGHTDQVTALCQFQEKLLISGGGNLDSTLIVWSIAQQKQVHVLKGHQSGITSIVDLQDGLSIVSGSYDNHAIIWNVADGEPICALRKHTAMISCLSLTQRRDYLLSGSWDRTIGVWEIIFNQKQVKGAKYLREIKTEGAVLCMQMISERVAAYGGTGNKIILIDWFSSEIKRKLSTSQFGVCELILSDNFLIGLGSNDATIRVWDLKNSKDEEMGSLKDKNNIYINNYNTNPKMMEIGRGRIGIINNNDKNVHFDVYKLSIDG